MSNFVYQIEVDRYEIFIVHKLYNDVFEKNAESLKQALVETENRIKKLEEHKKIEQKRLVNINNKTISRLERNLENLRKKRESILKELED